MSVNPDYGTLEDFRQFLEEAHSRGMKVITELVVNHTSDQHAWFQRARKAPAGSPERNFYVWSDDMDKYSETRIIFRISKHPTGPGIRSPSSISGIVSITTSPI